MTIETRYYIRTRGNKYSVDDTRAYMSDIAGINSSLCAVSLAGWDEKENLVFEVWNGNLDGLQEDYLYHEVTDWNPMEQEEYVSMRGGTIYVNGFVAEDQTAARNRYFPSVDA